MRERAIRGRTSRRRWRAWARRSRQNSASAATSVLRSRRAGEVGRVVAADRPPPVAARCSSSASSGGRRRRGCWRGWRRRREAGRAVGVAALDLDRVLRVVGDDRGVALLLPPAECGHVVVVAVQQAGLAGAGLRRPVGLPAMRARAPSSIQRGDIRRRPRDRTLQRPRRRARRSRGRAMPGTLVSTRSALRRACRPTTFRYQLSSSSIASSEEVIAVAP